MSKREFLTKLREYLSYELPETLVYKNIEYYTDYFSTELAKGRNETEITDDLGDPQLIAKSIIDAAKCGEDGIPGTGDDRDYSGEIYGQRGSGTGGGYGSGRYGGGSTGRYGNARTGQTYNEQGQESGSYGSDSTEGSGNTGSPWGGTHIYNIGCFGLILICLIIGCVLSVIGSLVGYLSPVLTPVIMVLLIVWLINNSFGGRKW